jgi:acyl-CoA reductase-like NAD-dependent aldehyde dehydrogenase
MLDAARERVAGKALAGWSEHDLADLARLLRRFADNLMHRPEQLRVGHARFRTSLQQ